MKTAVSRSANPLLELAGQKYNGAKLIGSPDQSKAYNRTSHHRRWYSELSEHLTPLVVKEAPLRSRAQHG
jgi:hypothetical protein